MTTDYQAQVEELLDQTFVLPDGPSKLALLEEAVRLADSHQDVALGDDVRDDLIRTATFSGYPEKALVAFSWRLAQADRDPEQFPDCRLLWQYKWIAGKLKNFPQISRKQIDDALDDMAQRCQRAGCGLRSIHKLRADDARDMGEPDEARRHYRAWEKTPRDYNSDCLACEQDHRVTHYLFLGKKEKALELAQPILRGAMRCAEIPHITYASVLLPLLQLGQVEQAAEYHHKGYRPIATNRNYLAQIGDHLLFLALTENLSRGIHLFEKHVSWALEVNDQRERWLFFLGARFLLSRVVENGTTSLKLRLPKALPCYQEEGRYESAVLASWVDETCRDLAAQFDARNGNDGFARRLTAQRRLKRWLTPYPLGRSRKGD
jgi:hypothetical protein